MMEPMEHDFVNDEPLAAESNGPVRRRRRPRPSVLEPPPRRREQIRNRASGTRERTELFLRENPVPTILGALAIGLAIGFAIRYASTPDDRKDVELKTPFGGHWSVLSLPFLWPFFKLVREKYEDSADAVRGGVGRLKKVDIDDYTKPIRKRWRSWTH